MRQIPIGQAQTPPPQDWQAQLAQIQERIGTLRQELFGDVAGRLSPDLRNLLIFAGFFTIIKRPAWLFLILGLRVLRTLGEQGGLQPEQRTTPAV